ncbi:quinone-dependent dihydroorotate dehydrogenase [Fodinibius salsisoli]|uniref:Dihydroorotate dehydrogenase (quinone) n=1 Tax=Fodinibius salsisoli TaxID=2820877 RepID=A0ABT3PJ53_9BACT|nr:quinone-dependent dihydroorotate dehydrogenase [Fodinibius salsisoli]MCW9705942.1 quinone-dependent dihydroorotate dehydrogenase [Fodinibius salsisoli]
MLYNSLVKPLLFQLEAEQAHDLTNQFAQKASKSSLLQSLAKAIYNFQSPRLCQNIWGLKFRNPLGLAAGFDKNGKVPEIMQALGFGFVEIGSITGNPSTGNPKPRMFRLPQDRALINRMGLNNDGAKTVVKRLKNKKLSIPLGVNIAKTHDPKVLGDLAIRDYVHSFQEAKKVADYITVNISCPNTTEGKTFEDPAALEELLSALNIRDDARLVPTLVKVSSDLNHDQLLALLDVCEDHRVHGYVACNTSSQRENLTTSPSEIKRIGRGGLSGSPIAAKSIRIIGWISDATKGQKPIIGVGGIDSFSTALNMMLAGADLLQVYSGLIYEGPGLIKSINRQLLGQLKELNVDSIHQLVTASG